MEFLKASLKKDENQKIIELKKIIALGKKLNKDTRPDEKKLELLQKDDDSLAIIPEKNTNTNTNSNKNSNIDTIQTKTPKIEQNDEKNFINSIKSVSTLNNNLIIDFNVDITKNDIKFLQLNQNQSHKFALDINGHYKNASSTNLNMNGIDKITLGQNKPDVLRIILSNDKNFDLSYKLNKKQLVVTVNNLNTKKIEETKQPLKEGTNQNTVVNSKKSNSSIESISNEDNKIIIKFNKDITKQDIKANSFKNKNNFENIFDIKGTYDSIDETILDIDGIDKIVTTQNDKNIVRIRVINKTNPKISQTLNKKELILSFDLPATKNQNKEAETVTTATRSMNKTIVIDAGHGADDVGAVGPRKEYEKVVNLNVSKYLYSILKQRGYKVFLTRNNDTFIKVMDRTILANEKNADIFISVHTNAVPKEKASEISGIETFFLSPARSERAKRVAELENKSDIREMSNSSKDVFLESLNRPRITASHKLAIDVQAGLLQSAKNKYKDIKDSGVREGPFWVLVGAQMPSILVELGYISHPTESKRLYDKDYQQSLANGIANGVDSYFSKNP